MEAQMSVEGSRAGIGRATAWWRAIMVLGIVVVLDQLTKRLIGDGIAPGDDDAILPFLKLVHVRNTGVAFGFLPGGGLVVLILTGAALALLVVYFARRPTKALLWLPTGMLLGGATGNLADRIREGAVTDFIKIPLWPAFNIADVAITFGVLVLLYVMERGRADA
jgi:signal peptidase II